MSAPAADPGERLERAQAALQHLGERHQARRGADSVPGAEVPVTPALAQLFPEGGIRQGSTIRVPSSPSLVMALLADAARAVGLFR